VLAHKIQSSRRPGARGFVHA